ncbi:AcvB/VirJ family lysyl-phosphatidylglycerol hydrolase [Aliihoeflea sp. PC F10.4]
MRFGIASGCGMLVALAMVAGPALADTEPISSGRLNDVPVIVPQGDATSLIVQFSDRSGWSEDDDALANAFADAGAVVLAVDYETYAEALDADGGQCLYLGGELTDLAQKAQRSIGIDAYMQPVLAGREEGASLAFMALADAPANTFSGAIALGYRNALSLRLPICPGPAVEETQGNWRSYAIENELPEDAFVFAPSDVMQEMQASLSSLRTVHLSEQDDDIFLTEAISALHRLLVPDDVFAGLPVVQLDGDGAQGLVVFISGDGGWRDLDKTMGEWLASQGYDVLGFDALAYFWRQRTPDELAADIQRIVSIADPDAALPVMLVGYSFGADALPLAWPLLPQALRDRVRVIGLLAPGQSTSLEVTVAGWLGVQGQEQYDVAGAIAALPPQKVLCIYGTDDTASSCPLEHLPAGSVIATSGGHHFDGNYVALAQALVTRFNTARD